MSPSDTPRELPPIRRAGTVALAGRPNVGKSTLLNAMIGQRLAITSPVPQTTRDRILGVVRHEDAQIAVLDTPGLHKPHSRLGRAMNQAARDAVAEADLLVYVTDVPAKVTGPLRPHPGDVALLADVGRGSPAVLVVNKIDRLKDKAALLPYLGRVGELREWVAVVPISARKENGLGRVLAEVAAHLPERAPLFDDDVLTDRPVRFFAAEYVREQILRVARQEVPHAVAVVVDEFDEGPKIPRIIASIHVERDGQKAILVGEGGAGIKAIGTGARARIEEMMERQVHLELWVKVSPGWTESKTVLAELGYLGGES